MISSFLDGFSGKLFFFFLGDGLVICLRCPACRSVCLHQGPIPSRSACLEEEEVGSTAETPVRGDIEEGLPGEKICFQIPGFPPV